MRAMQALLWARIQPVHSVLAAVIAEVADQYDEFLGDETKRKWEWKRRAEQERAFWGAAVIFAASAARLGPPLLSSYVERETTYSLMKAITAHPDSQKLCG